MKAIKFKMKQEDVIFLVIDIQDKLLPAMANAEQLLAQNEVFLQICKTYQIPVIYTEQYPQGLGATNASLLKILKEMDAKYFAKTRFSAVTDEFKLALQQYQGKKIIIGGMESHICVFQSARDLLELGYEVVLVQDLISSRNLENKENALQLLKEMGAVVSNLETILFDFIGDAKAPEFRSLQKLIK